MGGFQDSESKSKPSRVTFGSPASGLLANLFGIPTSMYQGGLTYGDPKKGDPISFADQIFGPGSGFEEIAGFFDQRNPFGDVATGLGESVGQGAINMADVLGSSSTAALKSMTETGMPTDVEALVNQSMSDVAEQYSGVSGVNSSDFLDAATRTSAQLRVGADESAKQRQLSALGFTPSFAGSFENLAGAGSELLRMGEDINLSSTPVGRAVAALQMFSGMQPTGAVSRGNVSSSEGKGGSFL